MAPTDDECEDGIPFLCECGAEFVWRPELEDLPECCPNCRAAAARIDDEADA